MSDSGLSEGPRDRRRSGAKAFIFRKRTTSTDRIHENEFLLASLFDHEYR